MYYKIVNRDLYSFVIDDPRDIVIYKIGKWVQASNRNRKKGYHLLVFNSIEKALDFVDKSDYSYRIFKCKIRNKLKNIPQRMGLILGYIADWPAYMILGRERGLWPLGTVMVKKVMLTEEVFDV